MKSRFEVSLFLLAMVFTIIWLGLNENKTAGNWRDANVLRHVALTLDDGTTNMATRPFKPRTDTGTARVSLRGESIAFARKGNALRPKPTCYAA